MTRSVQRHSRSSWDDDDDLDSNNLLDEREAAIRKNKNAKESSTPFPAMLTESSIENGGGERRPVNTLLMSQGHTQHGGRPATASTTHNRHQGWGIHRQEDVLEEQRGHDGDDDNHQIPPSRFPVVPRFPRTLDQVAEGAAQAVVCSLTQHNDKPHKSSQNHKEYNSSPQADMDPHIVNNLWAGDQYWRDRRPVRQSFDQGRLGVEIDGIIRQDRHVSTCASTVRSISLVLAGKLATHPALLRDAVDDGMTAIPVIVYLQTMKQTLEASRELSSLKLIEQQRQARGGSKRHTESSQRGYHMDMEADTTKYDSVSIRCLGQDDDFSVLRGKQRDQKKARSSRLRKGQVIPSRGIILVVQPTDFNEEYAPPGPSIGTVEAVQKLLLHASIQSNPVVVISPRFATLLKDGWDQSGYQQSASFGGTEPPRGPTPWLLRDFAPPIYSWVGRVLALPPPSIPPNEEETEKEYCFYSHVSMCQSIMHRQRAWHIFAHRQCQTTARNGHRGPTSASHRPPSSYEYLASTKSGAGRPTRDICLWICQEFASFS